VKTGSNSTRFQIKCIVNVQIMNINILHKIPTSAQNESLHITHSAIRLQYFLVLILRTSRDTTKLGFLKLGVLNAGILNFGCFETGCFGFGCVGAIHQNWAI
jgi:hypothetical protein